MCYLSVVVLCTVYCLFIYLSIHPLLCCIIICSCCFGVGVEEFYLFGGYIGMEHTNFTK